MSSPASQTAAAATAPGPTFSPAAVRWFQRLQQDTPLGSGEVKEFAADACFLPAHELLYLQECERAQQARILDARGPQEARMAEERRAQDAARVEERRALWRAQSPLVQALHVLAERNGRESTWGRFALALAAVVSEHPDKMAGGDVPLSFKPDLLDNATRERFRV